MPTAKKRLALSLSPEIDNQLETIAKNQNIPQATVALNILSDALELYEDQSLAKSVESRLESDEFVSHDEIWK